MEGDIFNRPTFYRTPFLALPRHITRKYRSPVYVPGTVDTGVRKSAIRGEPQENWRLNQLSQPVARYRRDKFVFVEEEGVGTGISAATLAGKGSTRTDHLSKPVHRYVVQNKIHFQNLLTGKSGEHFMKNITKIIDLSWNTIYNYYRRELLKILAKRKARRSRGAKKKVKGGRPKTPKELKAEREAYLAAWLALRASPKKVFLPPPPKKAKIADLIAMAGRISQLAEPRHVTKKYIRPSIDKDYVDPLRVRDSAKQYVITSRVMELSKCPEHRLVKEPAIIPGSVKRSALTCKPSSRVVELATPKKKAAERDNDLKENPFMISPTALKYVPTTRIQELAQPITR